MHAYIQAYIQTYAYIHAYIHVRLVFVCLGITIAYIHTYTHTYAYIHAHIHVRLVFVCSDVIKAMWPKPARRPHTRCNDALFSLAHIQMNFYNRSLQICVQNPHMYAYTFHYNTNILLRSRAKKAA